MTNRNILLLKDFHEFQQNGWSVPSKFIHFLGPL